MSSVNKEQLREFLYAVDQSFPVPLSAKQNLDAFAEKLILYATLCCEVENDRIVSMVAGYTDNVVKNMGYISVVATRTGYHRKGYASKLVQQFISISEHKDLSAVHLYAVSSNDAAIRMYEKLGFEKWVVEGEARPEDTHLIYRINQENKT